MVCLSVLVISVCMYLFLWQKQREVSRTPLYISAIYGVKHCSVKLSTTERKDNLPYDLLYVDLCNGMLILLSLVHDSILLVCFSIKIFWVIFMLCHFIAVLLYACILLLRSLLLFALSNIVLYVKVKPFQVFCALSFAEASINVCETL